MTKLNTLKFGLAGGITTAICVTLITIAGIFNYCPECTNFLTSIYGGLGYSVSWLGVLLGAIYGFIDMFIGTYIFAWIYNKLL